MKQVLALYGGAVTLTFDPGKHLYTVQIGKKETVAYGVSSITGIINKPQLMYWAVNQAISCLQAKLVPGVALDEVSISQLLTEAKSAHTKRKDKAGDFGTMVHAWLETYLKAGIAKEPLPPLPVNPEMRQAIQGFFDWSKKHKVKFVASEQRIYSKKYKYAGTYDALAYVDGKLSIIDFKTSNSLYPEMFLQATAYLQAVEEEQGAAITGGVYLLRLSKQTDDVSSFESWHGEAKDIAYHFKAFLGCLQVYGWQMTQKKKAIEKSLST